MRVAGGCAVGRSHCPFIVSEYVEVRVTCAASTARAEGVIGNLSLHSTPAHACPSRSRSSDTLRTIRKGRSMIRPRSIERISGSVPPACELCGNHTVFLVHTPHKILLVRAVEIERARSLGNVTCGQCGANYRPTLDGSYSAFARLEAAQVEEEARSN
jgi:hypothetical protein